MKKSMLSIAFVLASLSIAVCQQGITTFILLRHAEKAMDGTDDPDSNNIPWIANLLTGTKKFEEYDDSDFSNLLVVDVVVKGKSAKVTWLRY